MGLNSRYEIRVKGILDGRWAAWFGDLQVTSDGEETVISGPLADQAALHGLLTKVRDLGLFLISVRHLDPRLILARRPRPAVRAGNPRRRSCIRSSGNSFSPTTSERYTREQRLIAVPIRHVGPGVVHRPFGLVVSLPAVLGVVHTFGEQRPALARRGDRLHKNGGALEDVRVGLAEEGEELLVPRPHHHERLTSAKTT